MTTFDIPASVEPVAGGTLIDLMARAEHRAAQEGYFSKGKSRELRQQTITMCNPRAHARFWQRPGAGHGEKVVCGTCHPPREGLEVEWVDRP